MKYVFTDEKRNEYSSADFPVLLKDNEPFDLKPEHAAAYLAEGVIKPKGKDADADTIQDAIAEETKAAETSQEPLTESSLKKMKKSALVALAVSRSINVSPDNQTNAEIIKLILDTEPQGEKE